MHIATGSTATPGEPSLSLFQVSRAAVTINRPAREVWAVLADLGADTVKSWNPTVGDVEPVSGEPRQVGEVVLLKKANGQPSFFMRTIRLVPEQHRVLRTDTIDGSFCAFIDHSLYEADGVTTVVYTGYFETKRASLHDARALDAGKAARDSMDYLDDAFMHLKRVVESR